MKAFVVRVFVPAAGGETPLAGVVEHVGQAQTARFANEQELIAAIRAALEHEPVREKRGDSTC
jgi:hypothetical protein